MYFNILKFHSISAAEKEANVAVPATAAKREESNKREINRDGEKEERSKKLRKAESKENLPVSVEKKPVCIFCSASIII